MNSFSRILLIISIITTLVQCTVSKNSIKSENLDKYRNQIVSMFYHAYNNYINNAYPYDELKPISCTGFDTWGSYSLTLIDSLDMLIILGNRTEFERVVGLIQQNLNFNKDINVSVFETNIRIIGGLLSAHLLSYKLYETPGSDQVNISNLDPNWPCDGPLLRLAVQVANKLLPAFNTETGMPYGTVNLAHGVPKGETQETCVAGVGTFLIEFATLSRLTGDPSYEDAAEEAIDALWERRSSINLLGNHINVETGAWTAFDATIGSGVDSYFEYLVKAGILLNKKELLEQFQVYKNAIQQHLFHDNWYLWANMNKGHKTLPLFSSLDAYYPGVLTLVGDLEQAKKTLFNYYSVWRQYGSLPEFYNVQTGIAHTNRETYPLRPEFIESIMYIYRATNDDFYLEMAVQFLESIEKITKLNCGYATVKDVRDHKLEDRMESFFLAETLKYLYLIFDKDNFLHNDNSPKVVKNNLGQCIIETGYYIFNTEAHPVDGAAIDCCRRLRANKSKEEEIEKKSLNIDKIVNRYVDLKLGNYGRNEEEMVTGVTDDNDDTEDTNVEVDSCESNVSEKDVLKNITNAFSCDLSDKFKFNIHSISNTRSYYP